MTSEPQRTRSQKAKISKVVGNGVITSVNKPGDGGFTAFTVQNGNRVETTKYAPQKDDSEVGISGGSQYDMLMVTQPANNKAQAFMVWWADEPALQQALAHRSTKIRGVGTKNQPIQRGDKIEIRIQKATGGGLDVTFDIRRGSKYVATFSFVVDEPKPEQPVEEPKPLTTRPATDPPPARPKAPSVPKPHVDPPPTAPPVAPPDPEPPAEPPPAPPSEPISLQAEINIIGASNPPVHYPYIGWTPVRCQIALSTSGAGTNPVEVTLRNQNPLSGGGQVAFRQNATDTAQDELRLTLTPDGSTAEFYIAGKVEIITVDGNKSMVGHASIDDKDTVIAVFEADDPSNVIATTPLMVRVRKNANTLTDGERDRFLAAFALLNNPTQLERRKKAGTIPQDTQAFSAFRDMHRSNTSDEAHGRVGFLPWHRAYLLDLERELQKADPSVALHYWRFDQPAPNLFTEAFVGVPNNTGMLQFSQTNPMQFWATDGQIGIERRPGFNTQTEHASVKTENQTLTLGSSFSSFTTMEQDPHNPAHGSFGGFVSSINNAARDPLFFMLHCNVDRLWAKWQWIYQRHDVTSNDTYPGGGQHRKGHNLSDTMWPWNQEMGSPRPNTAPGGSFASGSIVAAPGGQPTVGDMVDYQGVRSFASCIGLDYDDVPYEHQA